MYEYIRLTKTKDLHFTSLLRKTHISTI